MEMIKPEDILKLKDGKYLPSCSEAVLKKYTENHTRDIEKLTTSGKLAATIIDAASNFINISDIGARSTMDGLVNEVDVNGDKLSMRMLSLNKKATTGNAALMKFKKKAGMGAPVKIDLWHSGFWLKIKPLEDSEIANLEFAITDKINEIGKRTRTIGLSHYEVLIAELILDAAIEAIVATSLKLTEEDDIKTFININDISIIAWGLGLTLFPDGWQGVVPCKNNTVLTDEGIPKCNNFAKKTIDMAELFYIDLNKLDAKHREQLAKASTKSVEPMDALTYQSTLPETPISTFTYNINGAEMKITLLSPTADKYFTYGAYFLGELEKETNEAILNKDNVTEEEAKATLLSLMELQVYNHFIDSITLEEVTLTEIVDINEALVVLFTDLEQGQQFLNDVATFIHNSIIANIGTPSFTCDTCKAKIIASGVNDNTEEYIPLSVYNYFFILLRSKYNQILARLQEPKKRLNVVS